MRELHLKRERKSEINTLREKDGVVKEGNERQCKERHPYKFPSRP